MKEIIEDLFKIYNSLIDSNNVIIYQTINQKYTSIDKSMLTAYLHIQGLVQMQINDNEAKEKIINYLVKQSITSETGNLNLAIIEDGKQEEYKKILNNLIREKFKYRNRILKKLKVDYKILEPKLDYDNLILFFEDLADLFIMIDLYSNGNKSAYDEIQRIITKLDSKWTSRENFESEEIYEEIIEIITSIKETEDLSDKEYKVSNYYNLAKVVINLRNIKRYTSSTFVVSENVLFHSYALSVITIAVCEYLENQGEEINKPEVVFKALFHDFAEFTGNEIVTQIKNHNEELKTMFRKIEANDEEKLRGYIGDVLCGITTSYTTGLEGYIAETLDKLVGVMKIWIEIGYMNNYKALKLLSAVYQEKFRNLYMENERIHNLKNRTFFKSLVLNMYMYIKRNILKVDEKFLLQYFTEEEIIKYNEEIDELERKID